MELQPDGVFRRASGSLLSRGRGRTPPLAAPAQSLHTSRYHHRHIHCPYRLLDREKYLVGGLWLVVCGLWAANYCCVASFVTDASATRVLQPTHHCLQPTNHQPNQSFACETSNIKDGRKETLFARRLRADLPCLLCPAALSASDIGRLQHLGDFRLCKYSRRPPQEGESRIYRRVLRSCPRPYFPP